MSDVNVRKNVREKYAKIARQSGSCCGPKNSCCGPNQEACSTAQATAENIGYSSEDLGAVPEDANLGLGCGNPLGLVQCKEGDTVLDLGSGAGFDCFLAAQKVGKDGLVIGVDMTPDMIEKARENAANGGYGNVEFRLGEIEHLPVADSSVDLVISNCVVNLSVDKAEVFQDAYRALRPGGRMMISDIVLLSELPDQIRDSIEAYVGCVAGASLKDEYLQMIKQAGFEDISVEKESSFGMDSIIGDPMAESVVNDLGISMEEARDLSRSILSITVSANKPAD